MLKIIVLSCKQLKDIESLKILQQLKQIHISDTSIKYIYALADLRNLETVYIEKSNKFVQQQFFISIEKNRLKISDIFEQLKKLKHYKLYLQQNQILAENIEQLQLQLKQLFLKHKKQVQEQKIMMIKIMQIIIEYSKK